MEAVNSHMNEVFRTVRIGDLETLRLLVDEDGVELNIRDEWDSTPLYYACLCGHEDVVEFLLQNGAKCEANTFDAERCFYAALTQGIKKVLRDYKTVTGEYFKRNLYQDFLRGCAERCHFADIWFRVGNEIIGAHKIILSARCPYFATMLSSKWKDRKFVSLKRNTVSVSSFRSFISYLYIGSINMPLSDMQDFIIISKKCQMHHLSANAERAMRNFHYYADTKPVAMRNRIFLISIGGEKDFEDIKGSFARLAEVCIPNPMRFKQCYSAVPDIFSISLDDSYAHTDQMMYNGMPCFTDVCLVIQGHEFYCHKVFLCNRSDYFRALIHFTESKKSSSEEFVSISLNDISPEVFAAVLNFIYSDDCKIFAENVYEILYFSDLFLLPGLKNKCATFLFQELAPENVVYTLRLARMYGLDRLELQSANYIAVKLPEIVYTKAFLDLVSDDASMIQKREETDTIQIIDDIRHHLLKLALPGINSNSSYIDIQDRFDLLDNALKTLGLEA